MDISCCGHHKGGIIYSGDSLGIATLDMGEAKDGRLGAVHGMASRQGTNRKERDAMPWTAPPPATGITTTTMTAATTEAITWCRRRHGRVPCSSLILPRDPTRSKFHAPNLRGNGPKQPCHHAISWLRLSYPPLPEPPADRTALPSPQTLHAATATGAAGPGASCGVNQVILSASLSMPEPVAAYSARASQMVSFVRDA